MASKPQDNSAPPSYPQQVHYDAGPAYPQPIASPGPQPSPYNVYGGFNNPSHDPRAGGQYPGSPAPGGYASPAPGGYVAPGGYGPPAGYYGQNNYNQQPLYGGQGMYYGPQQGGYPPQGYGGYGGQGYGGYYDRRGGASEGLCAGLVGLMACCCCLDFLV